jgi:hypothetical protein
VLACNLNFGDSSYTRQDPAPPDPCESYYKIHRYDALVDPPRPCKTTEDCGGGMGPGVFDSGACHASYDCVVPDTMLEGTCIEGAGGCSNVEPSCRGTTCCSSEFKSMNSKIVRSVCIQPGQFGLSCL